MKFNDRDVSKRTIGLALSGGGSRAIAFHLGCLRALNNFGILEEISALSSVSGGSVIGAFLITHDGDFKSFEETIRLLLSEGLVQSAMRRLFGLHGIEIIFSFLLNAVFALVVSVIRTIGRVICSFPIVGQFGLPLRNVRSPMRRFASRTTLLELTLDEKLFKGRRLTDLPSHPNLIVNATELRTGSAFRFGARESGSWRFGRVNANAISVAHAVTASAAYPLFLPAIDEILEFSKAGRAECHRVILTDGGVYDNLGVSSFWPDRSSEVSLNVDRVDTIVCCSAGYGLREEPPSQFWFARMNSVFSALFDRAQNSSMQRLHDFRKSGEIKAFVLPYLGQRDDRLPNPPENLVKREDAHSYPTNFNPMPRDWIDRLSLRGEQLTTCLVRAYLPELVKE